MTVRPMSDRRFLAVLVALLVAAGAGLVGVVVLIELRDPVSAVGDLGTPTDLTAQLLRAAAVCGLLVLVGCATAVLLVRAALRT